MKRTSEAAFALQRVLSQPIYNRILRREVGRGDLDYEVYLRTRELLALQTTDDALVVPDELLFQILHQAQELWLKCVAFEATELVDALECDDLSSAVGALDRITLIARSLGEQIRILSTLTPSRFHVIRRSLGNGSGLESPGYNQLHAAAEASFAALEAALARRGVSLLALYQAQDDHGDLVRVTERFVDWDAAVQAWLMEHFMLVRRTIGIDKTVRALDGFPTVALSTRMTRPLFPALWSVRVEMTQSWSRDGGYAPGAERTEATCVFGMSPHTAGAEAVATTPTAAPVAATAATASSAPAAAADPYSIEALAAARHACLGASIVEPPRSAGPRDYRAQFPLVERCVYLNSNATGATPIAVRRVLEDYWRTIESWRDEHWQRWFDELSAHADGIAGLIGAPAGSVVCDTNVATLLARLMSCFDYRERPRVVSTDLEFPSVASVLRGFMRYGAALTIVPSGDRIAIDVEAVVRAIDERTQLVCVSHATFATGALLDVAPIVRRAREVGALVALDAYQSAGVVPIDVAALDVDFLLGGAHKWLCGSYESAFLYVRPSLLASLEPAATGWIATADPLAFDTCAITNGAAGWAEGARRFASGTPAVLPSLVSRPGLAIVRDIGVHTIRARSLAQTDRIMARADEAGLRVVTPRPHAQRGGIVTLRFPGDAAASRTLVSEGFICSYRGGLRVAPHFYNSDEDVDRFMEALARVTRAAS